MKNDPQYNPYLKDHFFGRMVLQSICDCAIELGSLILISLSSAVRILLSTSRFVISMSGMFPSPRPILGAN